MAKSNYRFKTIMVEDADRNFFSALRTRLAKKAGKRVTDKELFSAIWAEMNVRAVQERIVTNAQAELADRELKKLEALKAKIDAKLGEKAQTEEIVESEQSEEVAA
jgi:hypothetical protein